MRPGTQQINSTNTPYVSQSSFVRRNTPCRMSVTISARGNKTSSKRILRTFFFDGLTESSPMVDTSDMAYNRSGLFLSLSLTCMSSSSARRGRLTSVVLGSVSVPWFEGLHSTESTNEQELSYQSCSYLFLSIHRDFESAR